MRFASFPRVPRFATLAAFIVIAVAALSSPAWAKKKKAVSDEPDLPANVPSPLYCPAPTEAPLGADLLIRCVTQPGLDVGRVVLFYRGAGAEDFTLKPALKTPKGWYRATIPGNVITGKQVQYFF